MPAIGRFSARPVAFSLRRQLTARWILALILSCASIPVLPVAGQANAKIEAAIDQAIYLSSLEHTMDAQALYKEIHPDARALISEKTVEGWYQSDFFPLNPQPITQILSANFVTWTWGVTGKTYHNTVEITFIQPFGIGVNQYVVTETVRLVEYQQGKWGWFFGRSQEFVDQQRAIHDPSGGTSRSGAKSGTRTNRKSSTTTGSNRTASSQTSSGSSRKSCTLVELRPGYPQYRGLVTGLSQQWGGLGDWECLETLERNFPQFDKAEQDRLNIEAARYLGINGEPEVWLWENWMAIEAQRGLPIQCYACLLVDPTIVPINTSITQDWTDPRILAGFMDSLSAVELYLPTAQMRSNFVDNYQMRAHAFLVLGPSANATEVLTIYQGIGQSEYWYSFNNAGSYIYEVGGYAWVSENAYPEDQIFGVFWAVHTGLYLHPASVRNSVIAMLDQGILGWRAELVTGSSESLVSYLKRETSLLQN